jgi:hypothetical protein
MNRNILSLFGTLPLLLVLVLPRVAWAQNSSSMPTSQINFPSLTSAESLQLPKKKSPKVAMALSLGGSFGGIAASALFLGIAAGLNTTDADQKLVNGLILTSGVTFFSAITIGPGLGHFYAGKWLHGASLSVLRATTVTLAFYAFLNAAFRCFEEEEPCSSTGPAALGVLSSAAYGTLFIYDLVDSPRAVLGKKQRLKNDRKGSPGPVKEPDNDWSSFP